MWLVCVVSVNKCGTGWVGPLEWATILFLLRPRRISVCGGCQHNLHDYEANIEQGEHDLGTKQPFALWGAWRAGGASAMNSVRFSLSCGVCVWTDLGFGE